VAELQGLALPKTSALGHPLHSTCCYAYATDWSCNIFCSCVVISIKVCLYITQPRLWTKVVHTKRDRGTRL